MRVVVLVSGQGSNLQALIDTVHGIEIEIVGVGSDRAGAPALDVAASAAIPTAVFLRDDYEDRTARDTRDRRLGAGPRRRARRPRRLHGVADPAFVTRFPDRIVNVHPSLLPAFAGIRAIEQAIDYGVKVVGVTVHLVDEGVDTGAILLQRAIAMPDTRDPGVVHAALQPLEHELLPAAVRLLAAGRVRRDAADPRRVVITAG